MKREQLDWLLGRRGGARHLGEIGILGVLLIATMPAWLGLFIYVVTGGAR